MCAAIRCENLQAPRYGSVKQSGSTVGAQGVYDCNKGFTLKGNKIRKCLFNGQWSGSQPVCKSKIIQYVCMYVCMAEIFLILSRNLCSSPTTSSSLQETSPS